MAIYHFSAKILSRSTRNTVAALAYRAGVELVDAHQEAHDYSDKNIGGVDLLLPENAPQWIREIQNEIVRDRNYGVQLLSDRVEASEKRKDAQLYREIEFALPREFTDAQNKELVDSFLSDQVCRRGMAALACYHDDMDEKTGEPKPHVHTLLLTRELTETGLSEKKNLDWNKRELLLELRAQWAAYTNFHLQLNGFNERIDHRSYEERGINLEPQPKLGKNIQEMERKAQETGQGSALPVTDKGKEFQAVSLRNMYRLIADPEEVLRNVTRHQATFMWGDVQKFLSRYIDDADLFQRLESKLKQSPNLVALREGGDASQIGITDTTVYTTFEMIKSEKELVTSTQVLNENKTHGVIQESVERIIQKYDQSFKDGLSDNQKNAIRHMVGEGQIKCIVGYAGAGKTTCLRAAHEIWKEAGYQVRGLAPTGVAEINLSAQGIPSQTLHKFLEDFKHGRSQYSKNTILIVDEVGMVDLESGNAFLKAVRQSGVKFVGVGDGAQIQPVGAASFFKLVTEKVSASHLETIVRQKEEWQREATKLFGQNRTEEALDLYRQKGAISLVSEKVPDLKTLEKEKDFEGIVTLYRMSRQVSNNIYSSMKKDQAEKYFLEKKSPKDLYSHPEYGLYKSWQQTRVEVVESISRSIETHQLLLKKYGVSLSMLKHDLKGKGEDPFRDLNEWAHKRDYVPYDLNKVGRDALINSWQDSYLKNPEKSHLIMTYTNQDTALLNAQARHLMKEKGLVDKQEYVYTIKRLKTGDFGKRTSSQQEKAFSQGDRLLFTGNDRSLGVRNGMLGTIESLDRKTIKVRLDGEDKTVSFAPKLFPYFDQGWAVTVHKSQGVSVHKSYVLGSPLMNRNLSYVGMSRHTDSCELYGSKFTFRSEERLIKELSKVGDKLSSQDYLSAADLDKMTAPDEKLLQKKLEQIGNRLQAIGYVSTRSWETVSAKLFKQRPIQRDNILPQGALSEESRSHLMWLKNAASVHKEAPSESVSLQKKVSDILPNTLKDLKYYQRDDVLNYLPKSRIEEVFRSHAPAWVQNDTRVQRTGNELRFGSKGSLVVNTHSGKWYSHEQQVGGDVFSYLSKSRGISYGEAIREIGQNVNAPLSTYLTTEEQKVRLQSFAEADKQARLAKEIQTKQNTEKAFINSLPVQGSIAETYLRVHRGIRGDLPEDLRFSPSEKSDGKNYPALLAFARNADGSLGNFQKIYLDPETGKKADVSVQKRTIGSAREASVQIQSGRGVTFIAEGIETALSIKESGVKGEILAGFGRSVLRNATPSNKHVVLVADYDGQEAATHKALEKDQEILKEKGYDVSVIWPTRQGERKLDFNDILRENGKDRVSDLIKGQLKDVKFDHKDKEAGIDQPLAQSPTAPAKTTEPPHGLSQKTLRKDSLEKQGKLSPEEFCRVFADLDARYWNSFGTKENKSLEKQLDEMAVNITPQMIEKIQELNPKVASSVNYLREHQSQENKVVQDAPMVKEPETPKGFSAKDFCNAFTDLDKQFWKSFGSEENKSLGKQIDKMAASVNPEMLSHIKEENPKVARAVESLQESKEREMNRERRHGMEKGGHSL